MKAGDRDSLSGELYLAAVFKVFSPVGEGVVGASSRDEDGRTLATMMLTLIFDLR